MTNRTLMIVLAIVAIVVIVAAVVVAIVAWKTKGFLPSGTEGVLCPTGCYLSPNNLDGTGWCRNDKGDPCTKGAECYPSTCGKNGTDTLCWDAKSGTVQAGKGTTSLPCQNAQVYK